MHKGILVCLLPFMAWFATPDVKIGKMRSQVPGFVSVRVEDVFHAEWDQNKVDRDLQSDYLLNMSHIVAIFPSDQSTKRIPRTTVIMAWYTQPLTLTGSRAQIEAEMRDTTREVGGFIGNSPFPRFGDNREPERNRNDKGEPDKPRKVKRD